MIYTTVNEHEFLQQFKDRGRYSSFSLQGMRALFEFLEDYSEDTGADVELDVTALCCDYTEYKTLDDIKKDYKYCDSWEYLWDRTTVIEFDGGIIIGNY